MSYIRNIIAMEQLCGNLPHLKLAQLGLSTIDGNNGCIDRTAETEEHKKKKQEESCKMGAGKKGERVVGQRVKVTDINMKANMGKWLRV